MKLWNILLSDNSDTTRFAAEEFARLIKRLDTDVKVNIGADGGVKIGLTEPSLAPSVKDPTLDDSIAIDIEGGCGYITGSNKRSVLIAVYRFFREAGVAFVRPGRDGEIIPRLDSYAIKVKLAESAAQRYRGICLEGSAGYEHIVEMIDFAPKIGMNIFFTQLWRPTFALTRWYENKRSPAYIPEGLTEEAEIAIVREYERAIFKRGLNHHTMGHGWIPSILGEKTGIWHGASREDLLTEENRELVAEIGGVRVLHNGSAVDTSFCYGNPRARSLIVDEVVKYAKAHPEVDTLHFWLADQPDNQCECELCRDTLPADFYVDMLNELDEALTKENIGTRIVFLAYLELFWTPKRARIKNPDRFILLFAPIRRPYERPLSAQTEGEMFPFARNAWKNPCTNFSALHYLNEWKNIFPGECILFDYHLMWDMYNDLFGEESGRILGIDMAELPKNGMCGMISCQGMRLGIVGALPMRLMANALWSGVTDYKSECDRFYIDTYGEDADKCRKAIAALKEALDPNILRGVRKIGNEHIAVCKKAKKAIEKLTPTIKAHTRDENFARRISYIYLECAINLGDMLLDFLIAAIEKNDSEAKRIWSDVLREISEIEALYPRALDSFEFALVWHRHVLPLFFPSWKIDYDSGELTM